MKKLAGKTALLTVLIAWTSAPALAAPLGTFDAVGAAGHALWIPGIDTSLHFTPSAGTLTVGATQWSLTGTVRNGNIAFDVDVLFTGITDLAGAIADDPMAPKKELSASSYVGAGGPIDPATWAFATGVAGTLTGVAGSDYAGAVFDLTRRGPSGQFGVGANGKNHDLGLSVWYDLTLRDNPNQHDLERSYRGDINISANPVPEPGAAALFGLGLLTVGSYVRRGRTVR